jgi:hypothetical protein
MLPAWRLSVSPRQVAILVTTVPHTVWTFPFGSAPRWVSPPAILLCFLALRLVSPATMASADFCRDRSRQISPGNCTMLRCTTAAFTSTGKPDDFAVLCQLVVPCRRCHPLGWLSPLRYGSKRFLSIGLQLSPSLSPHGRSPFHSWLQIVVSSFSCLVFLQGTFTPFTSCPYWAHTRRCSQPLAAFAAGVEEPRHGQLIPTPNP